MSKVLYCGSFDPPTLGHFDIIQRASKMFSAVVVGIAKNTGKSQKRIADKEKLELLETLCRQLKNVQIVVVEGLSSDWAIKNNIQFFLRSIRGAQDFAYESSLAFSNLQICQLETVFILGSPLYQHISSSLIHELALMGHRLHGFVPDAIEEKTFQLIVKMNNN